MKKIQWELTSKDERIKFDLTAHYRDDEGVTSTGLLLFDGKKKATCNFVTPDFFSDPVKKRGRPSGAPRMTALSLAYYLGLLITNGERNQAKALAADWLGADMPDIAKAIRKHSPPKNAQLLAVGEPFGIIALLEPAKVRIEHGKLFYRGLMWTWRVGEDKASIGYGLSGIDSPLLIESPLKKKSK